MMKSGFVFPKGKEMLGVRRGITFYHSDTPTVPKDREAKPEEKFSESKYPGFEAGKWVEEVFYPINVEDSNYSAFKAKYNI